MNRLSVVHHPERPLEKWIREACPHNQNARVITTNAVQPMTLYDGLVYLVGRRSDSVIARVGAPESSNPTAGQTSFYRDGWNSLVQSFPAPCSSGDRLHP